MYGLKRSITGYSVRQALNLLGGASLALTLGSPAFAQTATTPESESVLEEVVISGQRASDLASLTAKREAASAVEVLSATEAGKLPDQNVAEAIRRLSGISTATDKGEGRYVVIRGIEPNLANVTLNNQTAPSPEPEARQVKLDDIPSALIGKITVIKSLTPDLDANAIAGQVDISTLSAFDKNETFGSARIVAGRYQLNHESPYEGDLTGGGVFGSGDQFGLVLSANYSTRPIYSEDLITSSEVPWQVINGFKVPNQFDARIYDPIERNRTGAVAAFDWRPSDETKIFVNLIYSNYEDDETRNRLRFTFPTAATNQTATTGTVSGFRGERFVRQRIEETNTTTLATGGTFKINDNELKVEGTYSIAKKDDPIRDEFRYRTSANLSGTYDTSGRIVRFTPVANAFNTSLYNLNTYLDVEGEAEEKLYQLRADYKMGLNVGDGESYLKFGAKYLNRNKDNDRQGDAWTYIGPTRTLANDSTRSIDSMFDGANRFGALVDYNSARSFFLANRNNAALWRFETADSINESLSADFDVSEKITAAYLMTSIQAGNFTVIPGVRVEATKVNYAATTVTGTSRQTDGYNAFNSDSYTDFFPGLNVRFDATSNLVVRGAVTTAIGRPNYEKIVPTVVIDDDEVTLGNPNLKPLKSVNVDASIEWYFSKEGGLSLGLFSKEIKNPIFDQTRELTGNFTFAGEVVTDPIVTQPINGKSASVRGLELSFQTPFTFLPSPFDGFGINTNLTFTDGDTTIPGRSDKAPMYLQSSNLASLQLYYEKYGVSARVAYSYRSKNLFVFGDNPTSTNDSAYDAFIDGYGTIDVRLGYAFTDWISAFAEVSNLTDEEDFYYVGDRSQAVEYERFGRLLRFGVTASF